MNNNITSLLVDCDCLLDYDLTLMKIFQMDYNNPDLVDQKVMHYTMGQLKMALVRRTNANPLSICIDENTVKGENLNNILKELIESNKDEIFRLMTPTGTMKLVNMMSYSKKGFKVTILCPDQYNADLVSRFVVEKDVNIVIGTDNVKVDDYDAFMVKDIRDIFALPAKLSKKVIFVQNYEFNITRDSDGTPLPCVEHTMALMMEKNGVMLIEVYDHKTLDTLPEEKIKKTED